MRGFLFGQHLTKDIGKAVLIKSVLGVDHRMIKAEVVIRWKLETIYLKENHRRGKSAVRLLPSRKG
jgi:hypothetical protein